MVDQKNPLLLDERYVGDDFQLHEMNEMVENVNFVDDIEKEELERNHINASKKLVNRLGWSLCIMIAINLMAQFLMITIINRKFPHIKESEWFYVGFTLVSLMISYPTFIILTRRIPMHLVKNKKTLTMKQFFASFVVCLAFMYISNFASTAILRLLALIFGKGISNPVDIIISKSNIWFTIAYVVIIGPIMEEVIFRKILLDRLRMIGEFPAIIYSSIAFGLFHLNFNQFLYATVIGIAFAYVVIRTETIKYSVILHVMINFMGVFLGLVIPLGLKSTYGEIALTILLFMIIFALVFGLVLINKYKKRLLVYSKSIKIKEYFKNPGTIMYILICGVIMIFDFFL